MKNQQFNFSDTLAYSIFSMGAVLLPIIMFTCGMLYCSHTYFFNILPEGMTTWQRYTAAWFIAMAWEMTVLVTTANEAHVGKVIPRLMALTTGVILLFFVGAFDPSIETYIRTQKIIFGVMMAFASWVFVELFAKKWKERTAKFTMTVAEGDETKRKLNEMSLQLIEAEGFRLRITEELTCPHCQAVFDSYNVVHAHKGHCEKNPNKRKKLNGFQHEAV